MSAHPLRLSGLPAPVRQAAEWLTGLARCRRLYDDRPELPLGADPALSLARYSLDRLGIRSELAYPERLEQVPRQGPVLFVANHPLGALEGLVLTDLLARIRPDLRVVTNQLLRRFPEFGERFIGVEVLAGGVQQTNATGLRHAARHLGSGGALLIFPAGTVGDWDLRTDQVHDRQWHDLAGRLALRSGATCMPLHIAGRNPRWFYLAGWLHRRLRTALLPRALLARQGARLRITCGLPISDFTSQDAATCTAAMRLACELLADQPPRFTAKHEAAAIISGDQLAADRHLQDCQDAQVRRHGHHAVYILPHDRLGPVATVLASERERTFRLAGEGTGLPLDSDRFDPDYDHILVWDHAAQRLVGGYRAVLADPAACGRLYSRSLFRYGRAFLAAIGPALEVGRSFVTPEYQASVQALDLLWRGLGAMMLRHPQCHTLFGCVSITGTAAPLVRGLLADTCLSTHAVDASVRRAVRPLSPWRGPRRCWSPALITALGGIAAVGKLLGRIDPAVRVPVLLRHYLSLGGRFADFSLNRGFNDALDGLIVVDLRRSDPRYIDRYLGSEGAQAFRQRWGLKHDA